MTATPASGSPHGVPDELRRRPVGVFDSGVGGLTVLHELLVRLPHEDFVYLADAARFPFGERTREELEAFSLEIAEELLRHHAKLLVVACNSATAAALPALRERMQQTTLGVDVLGVVQPGAVQAVAATHSGRVGLLATPATVESGAYADAIASVDPFVELTSVACPDLTAIIEGGFPFDQRVVDTVRAYCGPLVRARVDTVILGCTHYPLVRPMLQRMLGPGVAIITSGGPLARQVEHVLGSRGLAHPRADALHAGAPAEGHGSRADALHAGAPAEGHGSRADALRARAPSGRHGSRADTFAEGDYRFLCTGDVEPFRALGTRFLQMPLGDVAQVRLGGDRLVPTTAAAPR